MQNILSFFKDHLDSIPLPKHWSNSLSVDPDSNSLLITYTSRKTPGRPLVLKAALRIHLTNKGLPNRHSKRQFKFLEERTRIELAKLESSHG